MAMKLGIAPTFHFSSRFLSFRQFSSSYSSLIRFPVSQLHSHSTFPRIRLWQRSVATTQGAGNDNGESKTPQKKVAYDLSSGFLQNRRQSQSTAFGRFQEEEGEDYEDARNSGIRVRASSSSDSEGEEDFRSGDEEVGGWMGTPEPSKTFQKSSLYKQQTENVPRSVRNFRLPSSIGKAASPKPRPKQQVALANQYKIYSDNPPKSSSSSASASTSTAVNGASADSELNDFIPDVIKPEQPYIFSYSETPKVAPLGFREPVYSPFGPSGVNRPWTGRPPLAKSKKKPRIFDSFNPPPAGKKGVKTVQQPGPFPAGQGPKLGRSREEIMGAPLLDGEIKELVTRALKEDRQLNLGRDGLTHNMLNLVHEHWKRRRVCKIKCKGVPTVDMDNVCRVLEEKSGGKIIQRAGGVIYLFRGRNYNYKTRPEIPLMLWKPPTPIYPKLVEKAPEGLTIEEANALRRVGRRIEPICHLGKNGVYLNLVRDVQIAFRADDLVKVDCKAMNPSDYKKIGAKLRELVPCVLLSFERESILMWKGPKSEVESPDGVQEDFPGEAVPPFRRELPEDGRSFLEQTLGNEGVILRSAVGSNVQEVEDGGASKLNADSDMREEDDGEVLGFASAGSILEETDGNEYDDDTDTEESIVEVDQYLEAAYDQGSEEQPIQDEKEEEEDAEIKAGYEASFPELSGPLQDTGLAPSDEGDEDAKVVLSDDKVEEAVREFESLWEEAVGSEDVLMLDEDEVDSDALFEVVKSRFGGAYGAPAKARNKRNSNELVGRKALKTQKPRLDPSVLDRVPKDPSGLLEIDELAKLLAP